MSVAPRHDTIAFALSTVPEKASSGDSPIAQLLPDASEIPRYFL